VLSVDVAVEAADLRAEYPLVRERERVDDRDLESTLARGGGELAADPASADHRHPPAGGEARPEQVAVGERAQIVDTVQVRAGNAQAARLGTGREQQPAVAERAAVVQRDA
jgi:hypothetical protein